ncbi:hypothetical protein FS837_002057 [Tulasnella sp. UAMH 9824]|nr:hypothetical protein FS837_002057 [Tulasnella sp. UAMH 9824]
MADYYAVLGVPKTATKDDIKKAYRKAALKTHPDRVPQEQKKAAEDSFRAVNAAYEILADDKKKALYDKHGVWPPPATSNSTGYKPRPSQPEYKPFGSSSQPQPPFFDESGAAAFQGFVFTDPFTLFNMMFGAEFVQSHDNEDRGWIKESKVTKVTPQGTRETTVKKTAADGTVYITRVAGDGVIRHWIAVNGVETPTDRGAPEIAPTPRVPLSQTQPQVPPSQSRPAGYAAAPQQPQQPQPPSSSRHAPSASQPVNSAYDAQAAYSRAYPQAPSSGSDGHRRSASRAGHHERSASRAGHHERSASRAGHHERPPSRSAQHERAYRATSPPPVPPKENKATPTPSPTGSYPFAYPQAPPAAVPQRAKSPSPRQEAGRAAEREKEKDLRRNHTVPSHVLSAQAAPPMPRPQSPHFYRTRTTSEAQNPSPTKSNSSSSATQQPRTRYDSVTGQGTRLTEEPASYVFSDTEAARVRSSTSYRPSRSSNTVPVPAPQPMTQSVPTVAPSASAPRRSSSRYGHQHSQSMQAATTAPSRHHSVPATQPVPMPITNELGLGFVPPPSSGLGSSRNSGASVGPNPPLGHSSRNPSFEEIVYPYGTTQPKSSSRSHQQAYGNPLPNPPVVYREPWTAEAQQQARYRQAAV